MYQIRLPFITCQEAFSDILGFSLSEKSNMTGPLRWGICGCGNISRTFVKALKNGPENHVVTGVAASSEKKAVQFKQDLDLSTAAAYGSYTDLYQAKDIDVVYVGLTNFLHKTATIEALKSGKHVLCEKPMGLNVGEVREMIDTARAEKRFLMEGFWSRCFPVYKKVREVIQEGTIGEPKIVLANFGFPVPEQTMRPEIGGGSLMFLGCYLVMFSLHVFGEKPTKVLANGSLNKAGVDEICSIYLEFSGGRSAQLVSASSLPLNGDARVFGTAGKITIPDHMWCPNVVEINGERKEFTLPSGREELMNKAGFLYEADAVRRALSQGKLEAAEMPLEESVTIAEVLDECRRQLNVRFHQD